jgi:antitoxin ParD1/3/4
MAEIATLATSPLSETAPMDVSLTPELERRIAERVESGLYTTASEVVREGLRLLFIRDEAREDLLAEIQLGLDDLERDEVVPMEDVFAEMRERIAARRRQPGQAMSSPDAHGSI